MAVHGVTRGTRDLDILALATQCLESTMWTALPALVGANIQRGDAEDPLAVEGQMQGGAVQSLGIAMTEALTYDESGRLTNPSLLDYRKLTAADLPNLETIIVEVPSPAGPFGARGVGEPPIIPAPAAIANAIEDATGCRLTELPLTPEKIALALLAR